MARKKKSKHEEGHVDERWLVSYSDFITLMFVLFVVLFSMGQTDLEKYKALADSFSRAWGNGASGQGVSVVSPNIAQGSDGESNPIVIAGIPQLPPKTEEVAGNLTDMLAKNDLSSQVSVQNNIEGVLIALSEKLVFTPGTADLKPDAYPVLDVIIGMLSDVDNEIRIVGHTDTTPPIDTRFSSNWELSAYRALVIGQYLIEHGISPDRITTAGKGEFEPIFPNDTPEHRSLNSRAEIIVIYEVDSQLISPLLESAIDVNSILSDMD
jgi:chemotaxis protein MotB